MNSTSSSCNSAQTRDYVYTLGIFSSWREALESIFKKHPEITDSIDMVFNRTASPKLFQAFHDQMEIPDYTLLFSNTAYDVVLSQSPYLISLSPGHYFFSHLGAANEYWGFLALGCAPASVGKKHWQSLLNAVLPDDSLTHFRFYSSYVLLKTLCACTDTELQWLLGPYSCVVIPEFSNQGQQTNLVVIYHPFLFSSSPQKIAECYVVREKPWWQATEEHLDNFKDKLQGVFIYNLIEWLWKNDAVHLLEVKKQYGELEQFMENVLHEGRKWGFQDTEYLSNYARLYIHNISDKSYLHAPDGFEKNIKDQETIFMELKQRLQGVRYNNDK